MFSFSRLPKLSLCECLICSFNSVCCSYINRTSTNCKIEWTPFKTDYDIVIIHSYVTTCFNLLLILLVNICCLSVLIENYVFHLSILYYSFRAIIILKNVVWFTSIYDIYVLCGYYKFNKEANKSTMSPLPGLSIRGAPATVKA